MQKDDTRVLLEQWDAAHPDAMYLERIAEEMRILRDRSQWNLTALGRYERPKIDPPLTDPRFDEVVLVTDGANAARAASDPVAEPHDWMARLRADETQMRPSGGRHSDVAMLHLRPQASIR
ncbi:MAG TPA: hypothetical protein VK923_20985 [Euzebyales bacterium]|nr:hypothetical protein [Euzebyales bacterium]